MSLGPIYDDKWTKRGANTDGATVERAQIWGNGKPIDFNDNGGAVTTTTTTTNIVPVVETKQKDLNQGVTLQHADDDVTVDDNVINYGQGRVFKDSEEFEENEDAKNVVADTDPTLKSKYKIKIGDGEEKEYEMTAEQYKYLTNTDSKVDPGFKRQAAVIKELFGDEYTSRIKEQSVSEEGTTTLNDLTFKAPEKKAGSTVEFAEARHVYDDAYVTKRRKEVLDNLKLQRDKGDISATDKELEKQARLIVKDEEREEEFRATETYIDKDAYKAAEKARKARREDLIKEFRNAGLSKRQAKAKADSMLVINKYASRTTRAEINANRDLYFDENGFSNNLFKSQALRRANVGTEYDRETGELTASVDHRYSLKEQRAVVAAKKADPNYKGKASVRREKKFGKDAGMSSEYNHTWLIRGGVIAGAVGTGVAAGALIGPIAVGAGATTATTAGAAAGGAAAAGATAGANAAAVIGINTMMTAGGLVGLGAGGVTAGFLADKGEKIKNTYALRNYKLEKPQITITPIVEPKPCPVEEWDAETCTHTVKPGDSWAKVQQAKVLINGKPIAGKYYNAYLDAQRLVYKVAHKNGRFENRFLPVGAQYVLHSDFSRFYNDEAIMKEFPSLKLLQALPEGAITFNCDADTNGKISKGRGPRYAGNVTGNPFAAAHYKQDCHDNEPVLILK